MEFRDLVETAQIEAISGKLAPTELDIWHKVCREYSKLFNEPLSLVVKMDPLWVIGQLYAERIQEWDTEEQIEEILDIVNGIKDPEYDAKKEKAYREELKRMVEEERLRVKENRPVHESLAKKTEIIKPKEEPKIDNLPKSGLINLSYLEKLDKEKGEF